MFKEKFILLCNQKGVAPTVVCQKIGLSNAAFSKWNENSIPRKATLLKIANYFEIPVDYFLDKTDQKEKPAESSEPLKENTVIFHRDGKTVTKEFTPEQMELITKLLTEIPGEIKDK